MNSKNAKAAGARRGRGRSFVAKAIEILERRTLLTSVVVNTTLDQLDPPGSGTVSLRDAIIIADTSTTPTTISFSPTVFSGVKTILLKDGVLGFVNTVRATTITGPSAGVIISGNHLTKVILINPGVTATLNGISVINGTSPVAGAGLENFGSLTFENGMISGNTVNSGSGGGGIFSEGSLVLRNVTISGNSSGGHGGGLENFANSQSGLGVANLTNVSVINNISGSSATALPGGGGIASDSNGGPGSSKLLLTNVTIAGNSTTASGGGLLLDSSNVGATFRNVTIAGNTAAKGGGGMINASPNGLSIGNTIIAGNHSKSSGGAPDVQGTIKSAGHNLVGETNGSTGWISTDLTGTVAKPLAAHLGTLASNGGPTQTILPLAGSPAIDGGLNSLVVSGVTTDQRGVPRIVDGTVDIGAVEVQPSITLSTISGEVFNDGNGNGKIDGNDLGLGLWQVYIDANKNDKFDAGDTEVTTSISGGFSFAGLKAGTYEIRVVQLAGTAPTAPTTDLITLTVSAGKSLSGLLFGEKPVA